MSAESQGAPRPLPARPSLRHLKDQARDLLRSGAAGSLAQAQFQIARLYGFASWPKLKAHIESLELAGQLKQAIDENDLARVKAMVASSPQLHGAPIGYGKNGALTWVAECRVPWGPPTPERLAMARWLVENGSDVHQGGDAPLMRAALSDHRIAMMELLVSHGANVNGSFGGYFPVIFAACEAVAPAALKWLLDHGANPNCADPARRYPGTALDFVMETYARSPGLGACIDHLLDAGASTRHDAPVVLELMRGRLDRVAALLDAEPGLVERRWSDLDFGTTAARRLTLQGATLLHVAAEFGSLEGARLLLDRGADANAHAEHDAAGSGGQTPIFHAVTQYWDFGLPVARLLVERGADLSLVVKLPGHYERPDEFVECTPLGYALRFPERDADRETITFLREQGAPER